MVALNIKETTSSKLDTIPFKQGQYIYVINDDDMATLYYDSVISNKRIPIKSIEIPLTEEEITEFINELWKEE